MSKNFEDAVHWTAGRPVANTNCNDAVHPVVFPGAGLEHGVHSKIVARRIDVFAFVQALHHLWRTGAQALISHDDQLSIRRFEYETHVQLDARVFTNILPIVARHDFARQTLALKRATRNYSDATERIWSL